MIIRSRLSRFVFFSILVMLTQLAGCSTGVDRAIFVTKSSLSILDVDSTPPSTSIAYDRVEGFIGPSYESGGAPPVVGIMRSDGKPLTPKVRQLYATGNAAKVVSGGEENPEEDELIGSKRLMFVGTSTNLGLKVGIDATASGNFVPNNFIFGYRRKEYSMLPLGRRTVNDGDTEQDVGTYPSALAVLDTTGDIKSTGNRLHPSLNTVQYFATGVAATKLAGTFKKAFTEEGEDAFEAYDDTLSAQRLTAGEILYCFAAVPTSKRLQIFEDANKKALIPPDGEAGFAAMKGTYDDPENYDKANNTIKAPETLVKVDRAYAHYIYAQADGFDSGHLELLEEHKKVVCSLTK